jgi:hypothetical protein
MINREEKLARIKQQIAKAAGEIEHGDHSACETALKDALTAMVTYLETELPTRSVAEESLSETIKEPPLTSDYWETSKEVRGTKIKRMEKK